MFCPSADYLCQITGYDKHMIVLSSPDDGLILYHQIQHAHMAGQIARAWVKPEQVTQEVWDRLIDATTHHDDGWLSHDEHPTLDDTGRPNDFKFMPMHLHREIWRRSIALATGRDWLAGLLTTMYAKDLYVAYGKHGDADQEFINELAEMTSRMIQNALKRGGADQKLVEPSYLAFLYCLLTFWDGLSLTLIGSLPWQADWQYMNGRSMLHVKDDGEGVFCISPWALAVDDLPIEIPGLALSGNNWEDRETFQTAYEKATPMVTRVHLRPE